MENKVQYFQARVFLLSRTKIKLFSKSLISVSLESNVSHQCKFSILNKFEVLHNKLTVSNLR